MSGSRVKPPAFVFACLRRLRLLAIHKSMTPALFEQISTHGAAANLGARAKFRLTGADRVRYLNGQVTNDVRRAKTDETLYACVTDAKGRIAGDVFIHASDNALFIDAEPDLRETLGMRLERYIVADDVELTDVTEEWQLWHVWNGSDNTARDKHVAGGQDLPFRCLRSNRFGAVGFDLWLPASAEAPEFGSLPILSDADLETWRIVQKVPRWPNELGQETFPPEAGLEQRAMDFAKGCYIGQEVLSRIKSTGKMPREMIALKTTVDVAVGDELWSGRPVGKVTSVVKHPLTDSNIVLAMVKQGSANGELRLHNGEGPVLSPS